MTPSEAASPSRARTPTAAPLRVLVTGAASGIGRVLADGLVADGFRVAGLDRDGGALQERGLAAGEQADVTDETAVDRAVDGAVAALGGLDALVNAAGVTGRGTVEETTTAEWDRILAVNARGPFLVSRRALPHLRASPRATIVHVASQLGLVATPAAAAYCASKAALINLTRAMALDLATAGVTVNAVCPGPTDTPMLDAYFSASDDPDAERAAFLESMPTRRLVAPEEIVGAIRYLMTPDARSTTGAVLVVDGGFVSR